MSARPTRRQSTGSIRPQRPTKRPLVTGRMAKVPAGFPNEESGEAPSAGSAAVPNGPSQLADARNDQGFESRPSPKPVKRPGKSALDADEQRPDHARSLRMAVYAVAGVVVFAAAFIVLVLALNQLPLR